MVPVVTLLSVIFFDCAAMAKEAKHVLTSDYTPPKYVANFNYEPASQETPGSAGVTFAIGNISYNYQVDSKILWYKSSQFANLPNAVKQDLAKLLAAKGFSVRGPFDSYDLIPYQDKKAIDLYLVPTFELFVTLEDTKMPSESGVFHTTATVEVNGTLNLKLLEITTRELMWSKSIPFKFEFPYDQYLQSYITEEGPYNHDIIINDVAKGIEQRYPDIMTTIFNLIDPEEMSIIKKQCQELRSKKGY